MPHNWKPTYTLTWIKLNRPWRSQTSLRSSIATAQGYGHTGACRPMITLQASEFNSVNIWCIEYNALTPAVFLNLLFSQVFLKVNRSCNKIQLDRRIKLCSIKLLLFSMLSLRSSQLCDSCLKSKVSFGLVQKLLLKMLVKLNCSNQLWCCPSDIQSHAQAHMQENVIHYLFTFTNAIAAK